MFCDHDPAVSCSPNAGRPSAPRQDRDAPRRLDRTFSPSSNRAAYACGRCRQHSFSRAGCARPSFRTARYTEQTLSHLVAIVVDDVHGDAPALRPRENTADLAAIGLRDKSLAEESLIVVPFQASARRFLVQPLGDIDQPAMQRIVVTPVLESLPNFPAHLQTIVWADCQIATIKQDMQVASQQEPIVDSVRSTNSKRHNVCCFQNRKRSLPRNSAAATVRVGHRYSKDSLAQPWPNQCGLTISSRLVAESRDRGMANSLLHCSPQSLSFCIVGPEYLSGYYVS